MSNSSPDPLDLFIAYAPEDEALRGELEKHLATLRRQGVIRAWHAQLIGPGEDRSEQIEQHLRVASIILLLVSPDFLASDWDVEIVRSLEMHAAGQARVIPVILRSCDWASSPLGRLQPVPPDGNPIVKWPHRDDGFLEVVKAIRAVAELRNSKANGVAPSLNASTPVIAPSLPSASSPAVDDPVRLYELLNDRFSQDELADLCMRLGLDWDNLAGGTKSGKARELVGYLRRRNRIPDLVQAIRRVRPDVAI